MVPFRVYLRIVALVCMQPRQFKVAVGAWESTRTRSVKSAAVPSGGARSAAPLKQLRCAILRGFEREYVNNPSSPPAQYQRSPATVARSESWLRSGMHMHIRACTHARTRFGNAHANTHAHARTCCKRTLTHLGSRGRVPSSFEGQNPSNVPAHPVLSRWLRSS